MIWTLVLWPLLITEAWGPLYFTDLPSRDVCEAVAKAITGGDAKINAMDAKCVPGKRVGMPSYFTSTGDNSITPNQKFPGFWGQNNNIPLVTQ